MSLDLLLGQEDLYQHFQTGDKMLALYKPRRGDGWNLRPWSEEHDGETFLFHFSGYIEEGIYKGEQMWTLDYDQVKSDSPVWIASGDLWFQGLAFKS